MVKAVVQQDHIGQLIVVELQVGFLYHEEESIDKNIVNKTYSATLLRIFVQNSHPNKSVGNE